MKIAEEARAKACCAALYDSDFARFIFGDTLHPGGTALTNRLARMMDIQPGHRVVDLASGRGASAVAVSRAFRCMVVGIEFGALGAAEAQASALEAPIPSAACFVRGDAEQSPIKPSSIDGVLCECSMSIFPDKTSALDQVNTMLRPGGRFGLSDVTIQPGSLPEELSNVVGRVLCLAGALNLAGYQNLLTQVGFTLLHKEDASHEIIKLVDQLESTMGILQAWHSIAQPIPGPDLGDWLRAAPSLIAEIRRLVHSGQMGYWLLVSEKPA